MRNKVFLQHGNSLVEVLVTLGILVLSLTGLMRVFISYTRIADMSGKITTALSEASGKMEEIRNYNYDDIVTDYASGGTPGNTFDLTKISGKGVIYTNASNPDLLEIKIVLCWRTNDSRIMGEDLDLDGFLDTGEDLNGSGQLDSNITLTSFIAKK